MTTINPTDPRLTAFVLGELSAEEAGEIQTALDQSVELQTEVAAIREIAAQIETAMSEEPIAGSPTEPRSVAGNPANKRRWLVPAAVTAIAATLIVALALPLVFHKEPGMERSAVPIEVEDKSARYGASTASGSDSLSENADKDKEVRDRFFRPGEVAQRGEQPPLAALPAERMGVSDDAARENPRSQAPVGMSAPAERFGFGGGMSGGSGGMGGMSASGGMGGGMGGPPSFSGHSTAVPTQTPMRSASESNRGVMALSLRSITPPVAELPGRPLPGMAPPPLPSPARETTAFREFAENDFKPVVLGEFSTFSIDVDTAAYTVMRQYIRDRNQRPPEMSVRLEEYINYFKYDYPQPDGDKPFATHVEVFPCPWQPEHLLARIGIKGREYTANERPPLNLVFLVDVSGSMAPDNRLPLVQKGLTELVEKLQPKDRVAIVTYANGTNLALPSVSAQEKRAIIDTINGLRASGGTYGESGIKLAYETARWYFDKEAQNRVILCTDGDFNIGTTDNKSLEDLIAEEAKSGVFLTILGFGMGNFKDDRLKTLSMRGNGNYGYIDTIEECRRLLVDGLTSTLFTIAKDVKIQVDFNPAHVAGYRLLGYENRQLRDEDFHNDAVDAGDIGAGHTVTALYELIPVGVRLPSAVDRSRYDAQPTETTTEPVTSVRDSRFPDTGFANGDAVNFADELMFVKLRYKEPDGERSVLLEYPVRKSVQEASGDSRFASAVALYGMLLRSSRHSGMGSWDMVMELAVPHTLEDRYREEFIVLVKQAMALR
ncbi:MAG: von Willebrand factor type A domain-containing protein [Planctomycetaceae bacterium]|nr:von Willebrand factor type A domain-containing protein [Planctomycetaceae bacterium]